MSLFPRRTTRKQYGTDARIRARAHVILDRAMAGHDIPTQMIVWALRITGDLT